MLSFNRRKNRDRRSGKERRKDGEFKYEGLQRRSGKERRSSKERRISKDRRSDAYHGLSVGRRDAINSIIEFLATDESEETQIGKEKQRKDRYVCKDSEFTHVQLTIGEDPTTLKMYSLKVKDCSEGGLGILIKNKDFNLLNRLRVGDVLQSVSFFSPWAEMTVEAVVTHKTKIEKGENVGSYIVGLKSKDTIKNYKPVT